MLSQDIVSFRGKLNDPTMVVQISLPFPRLAALVAKLSPTLL